MSHEHILDSNVQLYIQSCHMDIQWNPYVYKKKNKRNKMQFKKIIGECKKLQVKLQYSFEEKETNSDLSYRHIQEKSWVSVVQLQRVGTCSFHFN